MKLQLRGAGAAEAEAASLLRAAPPEAALLLGEPPAAQLPPGRSCWFV